MQIPSLLLKDGQKIPQVGLGTWKNKNPEEFSISFKAAIDAGYRHFDLAQVYGNEILLGEAWKTHNLNREELFITTKIAIQNIGGGRTKSSFEDSLSKLQTDYIDLLLLHFPVTLLREKSWKALEEIKKSGRVRSIGVSNYTIKHLEQMKSYAQEMPSVNQVELHVFLQQPELVEYCRANNILVEAYSPLAHSRDMNDPVVERIAAKHSKSYAQIMLRWLVEQNFVVIPKSVSPQRIRENIDIFDFKLDDQDLNDLKTCDKDLRTCWSPVHVP